MPTSGVLLEVDRVSISYGHVRALTDVSLRVDPGEVVALLGANGAGKSSLLRGVSGLIPTSGSILLDGRTVGNLPAHKVARAGIAHVPEGRRVIAPLSVKQNLVLAARAARRCGQSEIEGLLEEAFHMFPVLGARSNQTSGLMSGGEQQMLAIARGLMAKPALLMLDEPSMGLAPIVIEQIYALLQARSGGLAHVGILLAEQSAALALSVAERAYVLSQGRVSFEGPASEVDEQRMVSAYLGS